MASSLLLLGLVELVVQFGRLHGAPQQLQASTGSPWTLTTHPILTNHIYGPNEHTQSLVLSVVASRGRGG